jgi:DNA polymerase
MNQYLHLDLETRSSVELQTAGIDNYAKDPTTGVWCAAFAFDDEPVRVEAGGILPRSIRQHVEAGGMVCAHNANFEYMIWNHLLVPRHGWPVLGLEQMVCTMAQAYAMSLPGGLDEAAHALGLPFRKDNEGYRIMLQLAKPRERDPLTWWDDPIKLERLFDYCAQDVVVERALHKLMSALSPAEAALWRLDQRINARGVYFDRAAVEAAKAVADAEKDRLNAELATLTGDYVGTCNSHKALAEWIQAQGVPIEGVAKSDVLDALACKFDILPEPVEKALRIRQEAAKSSTAKLKSMLKCASADDRLRFTMQYHAAGTGRWGGRRVQPHNFPRPKLDHLAVEHVIELLKAGRRDDIEFLYGPVLDVIASCLRGMLCAAPGNDLMAADFANIEGRVLAWLAGEQWKLDAFRAYDAKTGPDIYKLTFARSFDKEVASVTDNERQIGKVEELALGYQGWVGAFQTMAKGYNVDISDERAAEIAAAWRRAHPATRAYWAALEAAAIGAVRSPDRVYSVGLPGRSVDFMQHGDFLWLRLPSGRVLCYPYPRVILKTREFEDGTTSTKDAVIYYGTDSATKRWRQIDTYGGYWAENITQAVARDFLAEAMTRLDGYGANIVLHVHDEVVVELPESNPLDRKRFEQIIAQLPTWASDLPITAKAWRGKRYRK